MRIDPKHPEPRQVDRTVSEIAAVNDGRYDVDIHLRHDPSASASFAETHVRRLEAIRRVTGGVEREPDGTWVIDSDHLERAAALERRQAQAAPVVVRTLSSLPLERQVGTEGATWLDRELVAETPEPVRAHCEASPRGEPLVFGPSPGGPTGQLREGVKAEWSGILSSMLKPQNHRYARFTCTSRQIARSERIANT